MKYILSRAKVFVDNEFKYRDVLISEGRIEKIEPSLLPDPSSIVFEFNNCYIIPGLIDVHVHLREPGFSYKETIYSGTMAAAHGGYTSVCSMPNLTPPPDCMENLQIQLDLIKENAVINVLPYGTITKGQQGRELSDFDTLKGSVAAFSDDGRGVQNDNIMKRAMIKAKQSGKLIAAHCEDNSLLDGGYIHKGEYAKLHGHKGISSESEWKQIKRDLALVKETGCSYHVCHVSTKESVELIRQAKAENLDVTCETAPHYLLLNDMMLKEDGRFKMNPPLRSEEDRLALIEGIKDGSIDMIATDHAPHSADEKDKGLQGSLMGVVGLESAFPVLYTGLVKPGIITLEKLITLMHTNPSKRFKIGDAVKEGQFADLTVFDLNKEYVINPDEFFSKGRSTPFEGKKVFGKCKFTMVRGRIVWQENLTKK